MTVADAECSPRLWRRIADELRPYAKHLLALLVLSLLATPLVLLLPLPLKIAVDNVLSDRPLPGWIDALLPASLQDTGSLLIIVAALQVLIVLLRGLQTLATTVYQSWIGEHLTLHFRSRLFANAQRVSFAFHDARGTSDSLYRIQYDAKALENLAVASLIPQFVALVTFIAMVAVIMQIDVVLGLLSVCVAPLFVLYQRYFRRRMRPRYTESWEIDSRAIGVVHETLGAFRVVKAFGREAHELGRFVDHARDGVVARVRLARAEAVFFLVVSLTTALGTAAVLYVGVRGVGSGRLTLGSLLLVIGYLSQLYMPLERLTNAAASIQAFLANAERAFELLDAYPDVRERPRAAPLKRASGALAFRGVSFGYTPDAAVLRHFDLDVPAGMRLGIAGATGAGKTTLAALVTRFYDPDSGSILLDGRDLREYRLADLRRQFAVVPQEAVLFGTSIAENIAYADPGASRDAVVAAATAAGAHAFIEQLPQGYATLVGERGLRLSGGERQRVALARAFLRDAPVLILDEPTSSIDVATEASIMDTMEQLMRGRTTLLIAHRLGTLDRCDEVLVLKDGHPARVAPHEVAAVLSDSATRIRHVSPAGDGQQ